MQLQNGHRPVAQNPPGGQESRMDDFALLRLQVEWGADETLAEEPVDRLRPLARPAPVAVPRAAVPPAEATVAATPAAAPAASAPRGTPAERAVAAAGQADSLAGLRAAIAAFDGCALRETASHLVFAEGNLDAGLLLIGEPPGSDEDRAGTPFAGREGALLDKMLASIGLDRSGLLLAPLIPWRPPGGRTPNPGELTVCLPFLQRIIALAEPRRIVLLGGLAARTLLGPTAARRRGPVGWVDWTVPGMATPVPTLALPGLAALLKTPALRKDAWAGLRLLRRALDAG
jgi:DNA polymerase